MKRTKSVARWSTILALGMPSLAAICAAAQTRTFNVHLLGNISGGTAAYVTAINNAGEAVGEVTGSSVCAGQCAVILQDGTPTLLGAVEGTIGSIAYSVNNADQVSGFAYVTDVPTDQAVIWNNGTPTLLAAPGAQYASTSGSALNDAGQVAGSAFEADNAGEVPVVWNGSTPTVLGLVSGYTTGGASGINNNGLVVGSVCCNHLLPEAAIWRGTTPTLLPRLQASQTGGAPASSGKAVAANDVGLIVGYDAAGDAQYPVAWTNDTVTNLGWVSEGERAAPAAVNNRGIIVGESATEAGAIEHAALWSRVGAAPQDLNSLISAAQATEFELIAATGINDSCTIAVNGRIRKTGAYVALLLTLIDASNCVNGL